MRATVLLLSLSVFGCDDNTNNNNNNTHDLAMVMHDLSGSNTSCDVTKQDCGTGKKCVGQVQGTGNNAMVVGTCVDDGTVAEGGACTQGMSMDTYLDDCKAGFVCDDIFGSDSLKCRKICTADSDCGSGKCGDFTFLSPGWGWCATPCTPFSATSGCAAGQDCGEDVFSVEQPDQTGQTIAGFFLCKKTGTHTAYESCTTDGDCAANLWCGVVNSAGDGACLPNCDDNNMCPDAPVDSGVEGAVGCQPLTGTPNNAGYCAPM
jgi:hypothetical protein